MQKYYCYVQKNCLFWASCRNITGQEPGAPGFSCRAIFGVREEILVFRRNIHLCLVLRGPNLPGVPDVEVELGEGEWTIFKAVQTIIQSAALGSKADRMRRVWEPTYVVVYREHR